MSFNDIDASGLDLTPLAARRIRWDEIRTPAVGWRTLTLGRRKASPAEAAPVPAQPEATREMVERVFAAAKTEFGASVAGLKRLTLLLLTGVGLAVVLVAVGVLFAAAYRYVASGATLSVAAMASLFPIIHQLMAIGRDQVILETYLLRYSIALQLANSPDAFGKILDRFLDETSMAENSGTSGTRKQRRKAKEELKTSSSSP
jgi:hypothetical protein